MLILNNGDLLSQLNKNLIYINLLFLCKLPITTLDILTCFVLAQ